MTYSVVGFGFPALFVSVVVLETVPLFVGVLLIGVVGFDDVFGVFSAVFLSFVSKIDHSSENF